MTADLAFAPSASTVAHRRALRISDAELVSELIDKLGTRVVAHIVHKDPSTVSRWKSGATRLPDEAAQSLRLVFQIFQMLETEEADSTVRAWFLGMNPDLDDVSPADAVRIGQHRNVMAAARAFLSAAA